VRARRAGMLVALALLAALARDAPSAASWNPLKWAGKSITSGAAEGLEPVLAATIDHALSAGNTIVATVDDRLNKDRKEAGVVVNTTVEGANQKVAARIDQIDDSLEKRILQIQHAASGLAEELDDKVKARIQQVDDALKARIQQVDGVVKGALSQADGILAQRIADLDQAVELRLGNVDVIATKQRLGIEETLLRVAVLIGLVVFVVIVLVRLWRRYGEIADDEATAALEAGARRRLVVRKLGASLVLQVGAAALAAGVLFVLYQRLPMGAARQADELVAQHEQQLEASLASFDFSRARYQASQLELLRPDRDSHYRALEAKGEIVRDVLARPTLLTTPAGVSSIAERVNSVERLLGSEADPDLLVVKAVVLWQVGRSRRDEHEAASLCARALRLSPRGFALAPLARGYIEDFLAAPFFDADTPLGRDAESADGLRSVLTNVEIDGGGFPLAPTLALGALVRHLDRVSSQAYVEMLKHHAESVRAGAKQEDIEKARGARTEQAKKVVEAWATFTAAVDDVPGLAGTPAVLAMFRLNDVYASRARWFALHPEEDDLAPLISQGPSRATPVQRAELAPPRIEWSRRYGALLGGMRNLIEIRDAARWRRLEKETQAFDVALVAYLAAGSRADAADLLRQAALHAARLGLYVDAPSDGRVAYASKLLDDAAKGLPERGAKAPQELQEISLALALRAPTLEAPLEAAPRAAPPARGGRRRGG